MKRVMDVDGLLWKGLVYFAACIVSLIPALSSAEPFTARTLGDHGNVTVMEVTGNYDANNPDGSLNTIPRQEIAREFYRLHRDDYDFLVIFTNFDFQMPDSKAKAFYSHVKNDIRGIGQELFDYSALFGSGGKLQGAIDMGNVSTLGTVPFESGFETTLSILNHELLHRWGAFVRFKDSTGALSTALLGEGLKHWSFLLDSKGSPLYGNTWQDNGNGTFTSVRAGKYYSPLDLYLMGFIDRIQVPPMLLIDNPDIDSTRLSEVGLTITGTPRYVTIDDIIAAEGERIPAAAESQKSFKTAFIFITAPGTFTGEELYGLENIRSGWQTRFSILTDGKGIVEVSLTPKEDIPGNPGTVTPPTEPRPLPPNLEDAVAWLVTVQKPDGSWIDLPETSPRDTAESVLALKNFASAAPNSASGVKWLQSVSPGSTDYLSRRIAALSDSGQDVGALLDDLLSGQNSDGGWGSLKGTVSNPTDTALVLSACAKAGYVGQQTIAKAIEYLKNRQNADGGWGSDDSASKVRATADALLALNQHKGAYPVDAELGRGASWLVQRQNPDGGFGNSPSTVYDTATAVLALAELNASRESQGGAVDYILNNQAADGSWRESAYQTALAISAVWKASVEADLSIKPADIVFDPPGITAIPTTVNVSATISNLGRTDVPAATVALYDGAVSDGTRVGQQVVAFPKQSSVTVSFPVNIRDGNQHMFYVVLDPDNLVKEANKTNNTAVKMLSSSPTYDFELLPSDVSVSANPVDIPQNVTLSARITNKGTMNAYNVQVKYYIDDPQGPFDIGTATVDIPAGGSVKAELVWKTNKAGTNMHVTVFVDAFNSFVEMNEGNNKATVNLTVNGSTDPNLTVSYHDMAVSPNPASQGGNASISAIVKNEGFAPASNVAVNFYKGTPGTDGVLLGSRTITSLAPGGSATVSFDWANIDDSGEKIIYVKVDPDNSIPEVTEDDNDAFVTLKILSLPDLVVSTNSITFNPISPKEGDVVNIAVAVQNKGEQSASNITVTAYEGSTVIGTTTISSIAGNSFENVSFAYDTAGKKGAHEITIIADPSNAIIERGKENNHAFRAFAVQDENLWLTEQYISPNGDGVKDSTQFFFSLDMPQTVRVIIVNNKGKTVRTFSGSELENITGGNISWDGLDDEGRVVRDGQYRLQIIGGSGSVLGSVLVIVDNNRSSIVEAQGTKYLLNMDLTSKLPDIGNDQDWQWFPDESGILLFAHGDLPNYRQGIYFVSVDGSEVKRLVPDAWGNGVDPNYEYHVWSGRLSPDGNTIAFSVSIYNKQTKASRYELWVEDREGGHLTLLDYSNTAVIYVWQWSPDGNAVLYIVGRDLRLQRIDNGEVKTIESSKSYYSRGIKWSPDGSKLAYAIGELSPSGSISSVLRLYDIRTNSKKDIMTLFTYIQTYFEWLDDKVLIALDKKYADLDQYYRLWLINTESGELVELSDNFYATRFYQDSSAPAPSYHFSALSPDRRSFAYATYTNDRVLLKIVNSFGNDEIIKELITPNASSYAAVLNSSIIWSADNRKVAFWKNPKFFSIIDIATGNEQQFEKNFSWCYQYSLRDWMAGGADVLGLGGYGGACGGIYVLDAETGRETKLMSVSGAYWHPLFPRPGQSLSPLENYIPYYTYSFTCKSYNYDCNPNISLIGSVLNLTFHLSAFQDQAAVIIRGTAMDLNFEGYTLEYADAKTPNRWTQISPPSNVPVVNDTFATWVPPYEGTFFVRLTVWDKAGNVGISKRAVTWGKRPSITNIYKSTEIFSPNGDGAKDTVSLNYTVLGAVHLKFDIYDLNNNLIRTFSKDHPAPGADSIVWDGRDSNGDIVPDAKYVIKILDFEFFVEVDNTPPDAGIILSGLTQDYNPSTQAGTMAIYADLTAHALDKNLERWTIEYGEGDNPQEWYELQTGSDILISKDDSGNPILNPPKDALIERYEEGGIEFLVGKKIRITAEDYAGNKSTTVASFLAENILLDKHHWKDGNGDHYFIFPLALPNSQYPDLAIPGPHDLAGIETVRLPLVNAGIQYLKDGLWFDNTPVNSPESGLINLVWDNTGIESANAVRIKGVDVAGQVHYSNMVRIQEAFYISCNLTAHVALFEDLTLLKVRLNGSDIMVFDATKGDIIPVGAFPINGTFKYGDSLGMTGIGTSGKVYNASLTLPCGETEQPPEQSGLSLSVEYVEADCNLLSDGKVALSAELKGISGSLKTLSYYMQEPEGLRLLRQFNIATEGLGRVTIDTSTLAEGSYSVKAVLSYLDPNGTPRELTASDTMNVDRTLPTAQITYPTKSVSLCPIKMTDAVGDWFSVSIEGKALDNSQVRRYELSYGIGDSPAEWMPALTRVNGKDMEIEKKSPSQGSLGLWNVTELKGTEYSLKLKVVDVAGNSSCHTTGFSIDTLTEIADLATDRTLFSPNGDGTLDELTVNYQIAEYATVDIKVFHASKAADGSYILDQDPVRTIVTNSQHLGGRGSTTWNGRGDSGAVLPDGHYGIAVFAGDSCSNKNSKWVVVELDNIPPDTIIIYPQSTDPLGNIVEISGTADDLHFQRYVIEAGEGDNPASWHTISSGASVVKDGILGSWNTFGLQGRWTLRLTGTDIVDNTNIATVTIDLGQRIELIKGFAASPRLFSPNFDGKIDISSISYDLVVSCLTRIDILDASGFVKKTFNSESPFGISNVIWDGKDSAGMTVPDGMYTAKLQVSPISTSSIAQEEKITLTVDSTIPSVDIKRPLPDSYVNSDVAVEGTITDPNLATYSLRYSGAGGSAILDAASQNRSNYTFGMLTGLPEGNYTLNVIAVDLAENRTEKNISFTIDRTPPKVVLDAPKDGEFFGNNRNVVNISGTIVESNLESFSVRYGAGSNPTQWIGLLNGSAVPSISQLFSWKVGISDGVIDGIYTLSLFAKDKAGAEMEAKAKVVIDNTPPVVSISLPQDGQYIKAPLSIQGTAFDQNLDQYVLELSEGACQDAFKWAMLRTATSMVQNGVITLWQPLPSDGNYCLKLSAFDKLGNSADAKTNVRIDTHPPAAPVLSGSIEDRSNVWLKWNANTEPDIDGYNIYRDGQKINSALMKDMSYLDPAVKEGPHVYTVKAVDLAGWEGAQSNEVKLIVDVTGPDARIASPRNGARIGGLAEIKGTAYSPDYFKEYRVFIGKGGTPSAWTLIRKSPLPISYGLLAQWDTLALSEGETYSVKLEAEDLTGNVTTNQVSVVIDNMPPGAPMLLSATPSTSNVTLTWQANAEADLLGCLLYRNDQLANASGIAFAGVRSYALSGTTYLDKALPDGKYNYYLIAMDQAGNMSMQSNNIEASIDTHPPHATITEPASGLKFDTKVLARAETPDSDIASIQFQYKKSQDVFWTNMGSAITGTPFVTYIDPVELGLTHGIYNLRAVATDISGKTDPSPTAITLTYSDITAPAVPKEFRAIVKGSDATLTWKANTEADLGGYNIYRTSGGTRSKINNEIILDTTFPQNDLADGVYSYDITATDLTGNESKPSAGVIVHIYKPSIIQPFTPVDKNIIEVSGSGVKGGDSVELYHETISGPSLAGTTIANADGTFTISNLNLALGENTLFAKAKDNAANVSGDSDSVRVIYDTAPAPPTGLASSVSSSDVNLAWDLSTEADLSGYNLYRDGTKLNIAEAISVGQTSASSYYYNNSGYAPSKAFDGNSSTSWLPHNGVINPQWWQIDFSFPELISKVQINWLSSRYSGKNFELQAWCGYAWISLAKAKGNSSTSNSFDFKPPYRTDKIKIYITDTNDSSSYKDVGISEVIILKDNLITWTFYTDSNLQNNSYAYKLTAVDYYGFESLPSDEIAVVVADKTGPSAPQNLTATPAGSTVELVWSANAEPDLAGYNIYRSSTQGWVKINPAVVTVTNYTDPGLKNGAYMYRITAVDTAGRESLPSNEASATVFIAPPAAPVNLTINTVNEGGALSCSWEYAGSLPASYSLYRSYVSGGPYVRVTSSQNTSYVDSGLTNGTAYYYVVTAVDATGNESAYSSEASGVPVDAIPPEPPVLHYPASDEIPVVLSHGITDVTGVAEPALVVELFKDGVSYSKAAALGEDTTYTYNLASGISRPAVAPDGKKLAYVKNGSIWLQDLAAGDAIQLITLGDSPVWSPDGERLAYGYILNGYNRIGVYDLKSGSIVALTDDTNKSESNPSWKGDGTKVAFISNRAGSTDVWVKDLKTGSLTRATSGVTPYYPLLSPDGNKLAYFDSSAKLFVNQLTTGAASLVDDKAVLSVDSLSWSPDGNKLAHVSNRNGNADIYVSDIDTPNSWVLANSLESESRPLWSPDGGHIAFAKRVSSGYEVWLAPSKPGEGRLLKAGLSSLSYFSWPKSGGLALQVQYTLNITYLKGHFGFEGVSLEPGENRFHAIAADTVGESQPSAIISVIFDSSSLAALPDIAVAQEDIYVFPSVPLAGQETTINIAVWNKGGTEAKDVEADIYVMDSAGNMELIDTQTIASIGPGSGEVIGVTWNTAGKIGQNRIMVVVDPMDKILEQSEANNFATRDLYVVEKEELLMALTVQTDQLWSGQTMNIDVDMINSGPEKQGVLEVMIEDEQGYAVTSLGAAAVDVPYGIRKFSFSWNSGTTYAGPFKVHAVFKDAAGFTLEKVTPFTILPNTAIGSSLLTDKAQYGPKEAVALAYTIENRGINYIVPKLSAAVRTVDQGGKELFNETKDISGLLPGSVIELSSTWNTGLNLPGQYTITLEVYIDGNVVSNTSTVFEILAVTSVSGSVKATPSVVTYGNQVLVDYSAVNAGNTDLAGLLVKVSVLDPETQMVMNSFEEPLDLPVSGSISRQTVFQTQGYGLKVYQAVLQYQHNGATHHVASGTFTVSDGVPPVISVLSPANGRYYSAQFDLAVTAVDDISGVESAEYRIDGGTWKSLPVSDPAAGRYSAAWTPAKSDEGRHVIDFRATDRMGNVSGILSASATIDLTPPTVTIISPSTGSLLKTAFDIAAAVSDEMAGVAKAEYSIDAGEWRPLPLTDSATNKYAASWSPSLTDEGDHTINFRATDVAGNTSVPVLASVKIEILSGGLTASPDPVFQGKDVTLSYVFTNSSSTDITDLTARVVITDPDTKEIKQTLERVMTVPGNTGRTGDFILATRDLTPKAYNAVLQASSGGMAAPKTLASTTFMVKPGLDVSKTMPDVINLLVWVNKKCNNSPVNGQIEQCFRIDLLQRALNGAVTSYLITYDKKEFQFQLRNPYYSDVLIMGDDEPLEDHYKRELREKAYSGTGIISSLWNSHGGDFAGNDSVFGISYAGALLGQTHNITTLPSPVTADDNFIAEGEAERIDPGEAAVVAGWIEDDAGGRYPAIVLNEYGRGKTVYFAFDYLVTLDEANYGLLTALLQKSLAYIHKTVDTTACRPGQLIPVKIKLKSLGGAFDLKITDTYPPGISIYDPLTGIWVKDNPWELSIHLSQNETKTVLYYVLLPDAAGTYTLKTEVGYTDNGVYVFDRHLNTEITVDKNAASIINDIIRALYALNPSGRDMAKVTAAIRYMGYVQQRQAATLGDVESNIYDTMKAIDSLLELESSDVSNVRLMSDSLLSIWESRWYFGVTSTPMAGK